MSKDLVESFFPCITNLLEESVIPKIYRTLLPDDVASLCPEPVLAFGADDNNAIRIRNPMLFLASISGTIIGILGYRRYSIRRNANHVGNLWGGAYLNFAMMNIVGMLVHCLAPSIVTNQLYADQYPVWWAFDCYFTGVSSLLLVGGGINTFRQSSPVNKRLESLQHLIPAWKPKTWTILSHSIGILAIGAFLLLSTTKIQSSLSLSDSNTHIRTLPVELFYLLPMILAGQVILPLMLSECHLQYKGVLLFISGGGLFIAGLILDATICRFTQGIFLLDTFMATTVAFLSCDIIFLGLARWLDAKQITTSDNAAQKKSV